MDSPRIFCFTLGWLITLHAAVGAIGGEGSAPAEPDGANLAVLRPDLRSGFANGAWKYDRYKNLESLDAHRRIVVADLKVEQEVIDAGTPPAPENWRALEYDLSACAGQTVGIVVRVAAGGPKGQWANEEAFFDEISVLSE